MKVKNYERKEIITVLIIITIVIEILLTINLFINKFQGYKIVNGIFIKDNLITIITTKEERKLLYNNKKFYINDKLIKYDIEEDRGIIMKRNNKKYYELIISSNIDNNYKANDILEISIKEKKYRLIEMFKIIWDGDKNENNRN